MLKFAATTVEAQPYLYVERTCPISPDDIAREMGGAFREVRGFMERHGIPPAGRPMSVYYDYDSATVTLRAGFPVAAEALRAADDSVKGDQTPAGRVVRFTHVGPYATLNSAYGALMGWLQARGLEFSAPVWESYVDDPDEVPEERLRTEVCVALA